MSKADHLLVLFSLNNLQKITFIRFGPADSYQHCCCLFKGDLFYK